MEGKLIKEENNYHLLNDLQVVIATTNQELLVCTNVYRLSLKNCQAIELGYDLDELGMDYASTIYDGRTELTKFNGSKVDFIKGFQKALGILGDKKFSEKDMIEFAKWTFLEVGSNTGKDRTNEQLLLEWKSIQQIEFDVEIVTVKTPDGIFRENDVPYTSPKRDENDCLILKLKK